MRIEEFHALARAGRPGWSGEAAAKARSFLGPSGPKPVLVWLEFNACSGDTISMLNATQPGLGQVLSELVAAAYWNGLMPAEGEAALAALMSAVERGGYFLAVEGAVPLRQGGLYAVPFIAGGRPAPAIEVFKAAEAGAAQIIAVGTCAAFGGPSAARPNPSDSRGVWEITNRPVINVSGCPINPDWVVGTLVHLILFGPPELDRYRRPVFLYGNTIHAHCQRRSYYDLGRFAGELGGAECMFSQGCMGPITGADCPYRLWNDHLNWPVKAGTPCIGCTKSGFPDKSSPFYTPLPQKLRAGLKGEGSDA